MFTVKEVRTGKKPASEAQYADLEDAEGEGYKGVYIRDYGSLLNPGDSVTGEIVRGKSKFNDGEDYLWLKRENASPSGTRSSSAPVSGDKTQAEWHHQNALMFSCTVGGTDDEIIQRAEAFEYWLAGGPQATLSPAQNGDAADGDDDIPF